MTSALLVQCYTNWANKLNESWFLRWFVINTRSDEKMTVISWRYDRLISTPAEAVFFITKIAFILIS